LQNCTSDPIRFFSLVVFLLVAIIPHGCSQQQSKITNEELEKNVQLWQQSKIANYNFVVFRITMGTWGWQPSLIKVRDGQVISKDPIGEVGPMTHVDGHEEFETVEKMFATVQEAFNKGYGVNVSYNREFGYPEEIRINPRPYSTDQTIITSIKDFEIIRE
jgi:hypothetical protein